MDDVKQRILDTLGIGVPFLCSLATVDLDGGPWVRFVRAKLDSDLTLRIPTFEGTTKIAHIQVDPRVHITCGDTRSDVPGSYFQIEGTAKISREQDDREACWSEILAKWFQDPNDSRYAVVEIRPTRISVLPIGRAGPALRWERDPAGV